MNHSVLHAVLAVAFAFAMQSVFAQGAPKPPADKTSDVQEKGSSDRPHPTVENFHAQCIGCHGIPGYKTAFPSVYHVPRIAGQQPGYIVAALKEYKSGARSHPSMRGIAASLSEEQMQKLAEYYGAPKK